MSSSTTTTIEKKERKSLECFQMYCLLLKQCIIRAALATFFSPGWILESHKTLKGLNTSPKKFSHARNLVLIKIRTTHLAIWAVYDTSALMKKEVHSSFNFFFFFFNYL